MRFTLVVDGKEYSVEAAASGAQVTLSLDGREWAARLDEQGEVIAVEIGAREHEVRFMDGNVMVDGVFHEVLLRPESAGSRREERGSSGLAGVASGGAAVTPPMPGRVIQVLVDVGAEVDVGDPLLILEAMKMQNEIPSPARGTVKDICVQEGDSVLAGDVLLTLD